MRTYIVFYSWQTDLPNATNRGFIQMALEKAAKAIHNDETIQVEPVVDRDTAGVPGAPDIASTIFAKIDKAQVFVCDISIVNDGAARPTPNPNVLIELGYARKALGVENIIMVMNTAFGKPEILPFDLRPRRVVTYNMPKESGDRAPERKKLESTLEEGLRTVFAELEKQLPEPASQVVAFGDQARMAIESSQPNQTYLVGKYLESLSKEIDTLSPSFPGTEESEPDEILVAKLNQTTDKVTEFARLAEIVAAMGASQSALAIYKKFSYFLENQGTPRGFSGNFQTTREDYYKFLGHELFVTFISFFIRENRWELIADLLEEEFYVENTATGRAGTTSFNQLSYRAELLARRNSRLKLNRTSVQADILNERHTQTKLAELVPMRQFIEADYFLYLRQGLAWHAWSTVYIGSQAPRYLVEAIRAKNAQRLLRPLRVENIDALREMLIERKSSLRQLFPYSDFYPLENFNLRTVGSS